MKTAKSRMGKGFSAIRMSEVRFSSPCTYSVLLNSCHTCALFYGLRKAAVAGFRARAAILRSRSSGIRFHLRRSLFAVLGVTSRRFLRHVAETFHDHHGKSQDGAQLRKCGVRVFSLITFEVTGHLAKSPDTRQGSLIRLMMRRPLGILQFPVVKNSAPPAGGSYLSDSARCWSTHGAFPEHGQSTA